MMTLNRAAAEALMTLPAGVGARVHRRHRLRSHRPRDRDGRGKRRTLEIEGSAVPLLPGVLALVQGNVPGGGRTNAQHFGGAARVSSDIHAELVQLLYDPQTSGGLLVAVDPGHAGQAANALHAAGVPASRVGRVTPADGGKGHGQVAPRSLAVQPVKWYKLMFCVVALSTARTVRLRWEPLVIPNVSVCWVLCFVVLLTATIDRLVPRLRLVTVAPRGGATERPDDDWPPDFHGFPSV